MKYMRAYKLYHVDLVEFTFRIASMFYVSFACLCVCVCGCAYFWTNIHIQWICYKLYVCAIICAKFHLINLIHIYIPAFERVLRALYCDANSLHVFFLHTYIYKIDIIFFYVFKLKCFILFWFCFGLIKNKNNHYHIVDAIDYINCIHFYCCLNKAAAKNWTLCLFPNENFSARTVPHVYF